MVMRFKELDTVVLTHDAPEHGLKEGDLGAIVHVHADGETVEVEFVTAEGRTVAVLPLKAEDIRSIADREILHVREYTSSIR
jgi:ATP-dependent exoDNAse (exonuclease V) alpha subunit